MNVAKTTFLGSIVAFAGLCGLLYRLTEPAGETAGAPLIVHCAEALRKPMEAIATAYREEEGQAVELLFGSSQSILVQMRLKPGDLFLPADDSYIALAREQDLVAEVMPVAQMHAVLLVRPGLKIAAWRDLAQPGRKVAGADPEAAAISKLTRAHLQRTGHWDEFHKLQHVSFENVNQVANAVQLSSVDAGIVWDAVAVNFPRASAVRLPELEGISAAVQLAVVRASRQPARALRFARYVAAKDRGLEHFRKLGYRVAADADAWAAAPELLVFAGAMLRPAIEETLAEFEKREGVRLHLQYNGCGILVSSMKTGPCPDLYFACDTQFMKQVEDRFETAAVVSTNQLVMAVRKGNPHGVGSMKDLARPGLKVGVGHEQQCALGQLTKETFVVGGLYGQLQKNVTVHAPTGDLLVVQLRGGGLDAAVVYRSNVTPYLKDLDMIEITGIPCATAQQPVAVSRMTRYPQLTRRLLMALQTPTSRARFENLGFGWEAK